MWVWVLLEVPPHGCCPPWPETTERVAEWWWVVSSCGGGVRVLFRAGRRSAGLGSNGGTHAHAHAVGVRARVWHPRATRIRAEDLPEGNHRR